MRKTKFLAAVVALLALGMTACGSSGSNSKSSSAKHSHQWGEWAQVTAATCDVDGQEKRTCATCNEFETRPIEALGHQWGTATDVDAGDGVVAYKKCSCGRTGCNAVKYEVALKGNTGSVSLSDAPDPFVKMSSNASFEFAFNSTLAGTGKLYLRAIMDNWKDGNNNNEQKNLFYGKENGSGVEKSSPNLVISVNNTALTVTNKKTYEQMLPAIDSTHPAAEEGWSAVGEVLYGDDLAVTNGNNTIKYQRVDSYNPAVSHLLFVFTPTQA